MRASLVWAAATASAALLAAAASRAQQVGDTALDQLEPAPAGDAFLGVPSPFIGGHLVPRAYVLIDHAAKPLVLSTPSSSATVVGRQTMMHLDASLALWDRFRADVLLPLALAQGGASPDVQGERIASPRSAALGDLRAGLRIRLFGEDDDAFQAAVSTALHFPTGKSGAFVSEGAVRDDPSLSLGGRTRYLVWSASLGAAIRGSKTPSTLTYGGGVAAVLAGGLVQVGPEIFAATPLQGGRVLLGSQELARARSTNAELLLSARALLPAGLQVTAGGGVGLSEALGTPAFRLVAGLGWELPGAREAAPPRDTDADGIADAVDACPVAFGRADADPKRNGCPPPEDDGAAGAAPAPP